MKKSLLAVSLAGAVCWAGMAAAESTLFAGVAWTFGKGLGLTGKYLSTNNPDELGLAAGVTYYFDKGLGCDIGVSATDNQLALTASYDICMRGLQIGAGALSNPWK